MLRLEGLFLGLVFFMLEAAHGGNRGERVRILPPFESRFQTCSYELLKKGDLDSLISAANHSPMDFIVGFANGDFQIADADFRAFSSGLVSHNNQNVLELSIRIQNMLPALRKKLSIKLLEFRKEGSRDELITRKKLLQSLQTWKREIRELARREDLRSELIGAIKSTETVEKMLAWDTPEQRTASANLAQKLGELNEKYRCVPFSAEESDLISEARMNWTRRLQYLFGGHNQLLHEIFVLGPPFLRNDRSNVKNIVAEEVWNARLWWYHSVGGTRDPGQPLRLAKITGVTSRSPIDRLLGPHSERRISWSAYEPYRYPTSASHLDLDKIRVVTNYAVEGTKRVPKSLEVMVRHDKWEGFYFERVGEEWLPSRTFDGRPIETACMLCHASEKFPGELSPRPHFLKSKQDFKNVGYIDEALIERLLQY